MLDNHLHVKKHKANAPMLIEESIKAAINAGLKTITVTEHFTLPDNFIDPEESKTNSLSEQEFNYLVSQLEDLKIKYQDEIEILIGAEVDWLPKYQNEIVSRIKKYNFDYINGSVHFLGTYNQNGNEVNLSVDTNVELFKIGVDTFGGVQNFISSYYQEVQKLVRSNIYDNCAHLDLIKKFNQNSILFNSEETWYKDKVIETLELISKSEMSIEINTSGFKKLCNEFYPSFWILKESKNLGIPLTIASDAHFPDDIGFKNKEALEFAREVGYREICKYVKRERKFIKL